MSLQPSDSPWQTLRASIEEHENRQTNDDPTKAPLSGAFFEIAERLNAVLWMFDVRADRTVYVGKVYEHIWGRDREELFSRPGAWLEYVHPEDRPSVRAKRNLRNNGGYDVEYRIVRPNGEVRWIHDRTILQRSGETQVDTVVGIAEDITLTRKANLRLRDMSASIASLTGEEFLRGLVRCLAEHLEVEMVAVVERMEQKPGWAHSVVLWHDGIADNIEYPLEGDPCSVVARGQICIYPDNLVSFFPENELILSLRARAFIGVPLFDTNGEVFGAFKVVSSRPIENPDFVQYVLHFFSGRVTGELLRVREEDRERARLADVAHASRIGTMSHLATGIAHEVNQPLAAIVNYTSGMRHRLAALGIDDRELRQAVEAASDEAQRAAEIVRRMRTFLKKGDVERTRASFRDIAETALQHVSSEAKALGVDIRTQGTPQDEIAVDVIQIEQVLFNLLRNSLDGLRDRPHPREIAMEWNVGEDGKLWMHVLDNGPGIDEGQEEKIFESFVSSKRDGLGMGLSISRSIVESHGGRMWCEQAGQGAHFVFSLPQQGEKQE